MTLCIVYYLEPKSSKMQENHPLRGLDFHIVIIFPEQLTTDQIVDHQHNSLTTFTSNQLYVTHLHRMFDMGFLAF
jgi:hypothetical protein